MREPPVSYAELDRLVNRVAPALPRGAVVQFQRMRWFTALRTNPAAYPRVPLTNALNPSLAPRT